MDVIPPEKFEDAKPVIFKDNGFMSEEISSEEFEKLLNDVRDPLQAQRTLAARIKRFLDRQIDEDIKEKGRLSDHTRRWVDTYNAVLNDLRKIQNKDEVSSTKPKSISHSDLSAKIRSAIKDERDIANSTKTSAPNTDTSD